MASAPCNPQQTGSNFSKISFDKRALCTTFRRSCKGSAKRQKRRLFSVTFVVSFVFSFLFPFSVQFFTEMGKIFRNSKFLNFDLMWSVASRAAGSRSPNTLARWCKDKTSRRLFIYCLCATRTATAATMMGEVVAEWPLFLRIILSPILLIYFGARVYVLPCIGIALQRALRCCCRGFLRHVCCGCGLTFTDRVSGGVVGCCRARSCSDTWIWEPKSKGVLRVTEVNNASATSLSLLAAAAAAGLPR